MAKDKKGGLAILIAGKPTKGPAADEEYDGEDVPTDEGLEGSDEEEATETPEEESSEYPEFEIPAELDLSDMEDGDEKEVVAVIRKKAEGTACVVSVDGVQLAEGEAPTEAPTEAPVPPAPGPPPMGPPMGGPPGAGIAQRAIRGGLM